MTQLVLAGEFLVAVPASSAVVASEGLLKEYRQFLGNEQTIDRTELLALHILRQRADKGSKWHTYLSMIPPAG